MPQLKLELRGASYTWTERGGLVDESFLQAPDEVANELLPVIERQLRMYDEQVTDMDQLVVRAGNANKIKHRNRAEVMARRVLAAGPSAAAAAILSSVFRQRGDSRTALQITDAYVSSNNPALLTSRAAAFLDQGRPQEALKCANRAYAVAKRSAKPLDEIALVYRRLEKDYGISP